MPKNEWKESIFDHASRDYKGYKLEAKHKDVSCDKCHEKSEISYEEFNKHKKTSLGKFKLPESDGCEGCHKADHKGKFKEISDVAGVKCDNCHSVKREWKDHTYSHKQDGNYKKYNPKGEIKESNCDECHLCDSQTFRLTSCFKKQQFGPVR